MIRRMLELSTAHLPRELGVDGLNGEEGVIASRLPYGWLLFVPGDPGSHYGTPPVVLRIQRYARERECDFVLFDSDAEQVGGLPTWDW